MRRTLEILLIILVIGIFAFLATYGAFFYFKERDCTVSIFSAGCYRTYPQFFKELTHFTW